MGAPVIETVRPGVAFTPAAAASFRRVEDDLGRRADVNSTYRDWDWQWGMYVAWEAWAAGRGPKPKHSRAIHPDLSMHCRGLALDSDDWRTPGFIDLMAERGWIRTAANDLTERHHFEYQSWRDRHILRPAGEQGELIEEEETEMKAIRLRDSQNGSIAWANWETGLFWELPNIEYEALLTGWGLWDRTQDKEVPTNIYQMLKSVAASVRGSVDSAAIAGLVLDGIPAGSIDEVSLVARFEAALADNFAGIPADVLSALKSAL